MNRGLMNFSTLFELFRHFTVYQTVTVETQSIASVQGKNRNQFKI